MWNPRTTHSGRKVRTSEEREKEEKITPLTMATLTLTAGACKLLRPIIGSGPGVLGGLHLCLPEGLRSVPEGPYQEFQEVYTKITAVFPRVHGV